MTRPTIPTFAALCGAALALTVAGCKKPEIRVYTVTREKPAPPVQKTAPAPELSEAAEKPAPRPQVDYQLPAGWKDLGPSKFSFVNFSVTTPAGEAAVNITPLQGMSGKDAVIVNMWRHQVDQPPLDEAAAEAGFTPVDIGGEPGKLFEVSGAREGQTLRIITAFVHRPDGSWFYKLQGADAAVTAEKQAFIDFLKTVKIKPGEAVAAVAAPAETTAPPPPADAAPPVAMVAPEGWQPQNPGQMQVAKYTVAKDTGKADISVSVFSSDTGGNLANVNRWRRLLGLPDVDEAGMQECVTKLGGSPIDGAPEPVLVDLNKDNRSLLGAIVPREGRWWFYKMVGDAAVVNAEHDTFVQFVKSQP